jgi:hypothetical protein
LDFSITTQDITTSPTTPTVPEPRTLVLFGTGLIGAAIVFHRRSTHK